MRNTLAGMGLWLTVAVLLLFVFDKNQTQLAISGTILWIAGIGIGLYYILHVRRLARRDGLQGEPCVTPKMLMIAGLSLCVAAVIWAPVTANVVPHTSDTSFTIIILPAGILAALGSIFAAVALFYMLKRN